MVRRDTPSVTNDTIINRIKNPRRQSAGGDFFMSCVRLFVASAIRKILYAAVIVGFVVADGNTNPAVFVTQYVFAMSERSYIFIDK